MNIWQKLKKEKISSGEPILVLAPMADVTDVAFRYVITKHGKPDAMWTEFVSADGLILAPDNNPDGTGFTSQDKLKADLKFSNEEKPIIAQIFSSNPSNIQKVSTMLYQMGFDGVDINMGCPDKSIEKQKSGAAMIKNPRLAKKIIQAAKEGVGYEKSFWLPIYFFFKFMKLTFISNLIIFKLETKIPVSVKTRLGYYRDELEEWLPQLLSAYPALITIHARTRKQMSKARADWSRVKRAVEIRDEYFQNHFWTKNISKCERTLIFGNGDIKNKTEATEAKLQTNCDGVMIGRGIFGNPWLFGPTNVDDLSVKEKLSTMLEHTKKFCQELPHKNFSVMKKHYKAYVDGFDGAKDLRSKLMETTNYQEVEEIVKEFLNIYP